MVFRELQAVLTEEREMGVKTLAFCKHVFKDGLLKDSEELGVCIEIFLQHLC